MLIDQFNRSINYLRISVTDRCDFRCVYCMAEKMEFLPRQQLLSLEEISTIAKAFVELGITKIRITGGEPLIRRNISQLFDNLNQLPKLDELTLTTNGAQLKPFAKTLVRHGVKRVNVSLDSLDSTRFQQLTRTGQLNTVLEGIDAALAAGLQVKLNTVILKNRNQQDVLPLVNFAIEKGLDISFIEEMPLGEISEHNRAEEYVSSADIHQQISQYYLLQPIASQQPTGGPSRYWSISEFPTKIGFISPHSENFCSNCNRVRLTATGKLLLCLGNEHSVDLKAIIRRYPDQIEKLQQAIIDAIRIKPEQHYFNLDDEPQIVRFMNATGG